jgi:hypothetical protein
MVLLGVLSDGDTVATTQNSEARMGSLDMRCPFVNFNVFHSGYISFIESLLL